MIKFDATKSKGLIGGVLTTVIAALLLTFQNCSTGFSANTYYSLSNDLAFAHPDVALTPGTAAAEGKIVLGDRDYVQSVFADVFSSGNQDATNYLNAVMDQELGTTQVSLGRACDPAADGGVWTSCGSMITNVNIDMSAATSSIREAARVQTCRRLLNNDTLLDIPVAKVRGGQSSPNATSIDGAIRLFYPARDRSDELVGTLGDLDAEMAAQDEPVKERWRMIFSTLCESPTWEVL